MDSKMMEMVREQLQHCEPDYLRENDTTLIDILYDFYSSNAGYDTPVVKLWIEEFLSTLDGLPVEDRDRIRSAVSVLCGAYEKTGFMEGVRTGVTFLQETMK